MVLKSRYPQKRRDFWANRKYLGDPGKSFVGHPDATQFGTSPSRRVFQQQLAKSLTEHSRNTAEPNPPGESPGGVSPRGARRTGQDTLASSGSHHGATLGANSQWANSSGQRREMLAIQCLALRTCARSFLYLRLAQRTSSRSSWRTIERSAVR